MKNLILIMISVLLLTACGEKNSETKEQNSFVKVNKTGFEINGKPHYFMGTNFWYGINLGSEKGGQRERLIRELDRLQKLGIRNLRIMGLTEGPDDQPFRMLPAVQNAPGQFDEDLFQGLDFLLSEMAKRDMYAVVCMGNFWPWSGGFGQYLVWSGAADSIPYPPPHPGGDWDKYQRFVAKFYSDPKAVQIYWDAVKQLVTRKNSVTGKNYSDDPTIMAWQLCNEPRGMDNKADYNKWIDSSAALIKSWDSNHLVTAGTEGYTSGPEYAGVDVEENHDGKNIDYATCHIWVENWGWYDPRRNEETYDSAVAKMREYLKKHVDAASKLGKPMVVEEFGIARDSGSFDPNATVKVKDDYYARVFEEVYNYATGKTPVAGVNFWAWSGEGRPREPGTMWQKGDPFTGDPPHELQGWYSVYDTDSTTHKVIKEYADKMNNIK